MLAKALYLTNKPNRNRRDVLADGEEDIHTFDARITCEGPLRNAFRIFTEGKTCNRVELIKPIPEEEARLEVVFTDGSCFNNGTEDARAGAGVWFGDDDDRTKSIRIPTSLKNSNNVGELVSAKDAIENADELKELLINTDSRLVIKGATKDLARREDLNYRGVENASIWKAMIARLRERRTKTAFQWIKGHSGNFGNDKADELAKRGAETDPNQAEEIDLEIPEELTITGARLMKITQAEAYKMIRAQKHREALGKKKQYTREIERRKTTINLERTRYEALNTGNETQTDQKIWKSLRSKDLTQKTRQFMWRLMHDAHRVGPYWTKMKAQEYKERGYCIECDAEESMEHILTKCEAPGQKEVWQFAKSLWNLKKMRWRKPNLATVLASPLADFKNANGKRKNGKSRFYKILMTECAFVIWKIRNDRVIPSEDGTIKGVVSKEEIQARVRQALNERLIQDQKMTNKAIYVVLFQDDTVSIPDGIETPI